MLSHDITYLKIKENFQRISFPNGQQKTIMLGKLLLNLPRLAPTRSLKTTALAQSHGVRMHDQFDPEQCGQREKVGHGVCGFAAYDDRLDVWYPSVRFRANDAVITPIREKELGDWRNISLEEKKLLYRYSYQSTLAEFEAPDGYWKLDWAWFFYITSIGILFMVLEQVILYDKLFDPTNDNEYVESEIEKRLVLEKEWYQGPATFYDYEKNRWKD